MPDDATSQSPASPFAVDPARMFDLTQTQALHELFATPRDQRSSAWAAAFFPAIWNASLELPASPVFHGPDLFPYLRLYLPTPAEPFQSNCVSNLARQAVERAHGIAIFRSPAATEPEFVLSMGLVDSLLTYGSWLGDPADVADLARKPQQPPSSGGLQTIDASGQKIMVGSPAPTLLPAHTARALHRHLTEGWKLAGPRIALLVSAAMTPTRNLVLNRKLSDFPSPEVAGRRCRTLLWYLPPRRGLLLMPEGWTDADMRPLTEFFPQTPEQPA